MRPAIWRANEASNLESTPAAWVGANIGTGSSGAAPALEQRLHSGGACQHIRVEHGIVVDEPQPRGGVHRLEQGPAACRRVQHSGSGLDVEQVSRSARASSRMKPSSRAHFLLPSFMPAQRGASRSATASGRRTQSRMGPCAWRLPHEPTRGRPDGMGGGDGGGRMLAGSRLAYARLVKEGVLLEQCAHAPRLVPEQLERRRDLGDALPHAGPPVSGSRGVNGETGQAA